MERNGGKTAMEKRKQMDSIEVMVARIDERVKNGFENNDKTHNDIISAQEKLCTHVNHENELLTSRMNNNENAIGLFKSNLDTIIKAIDKLSEVSLASIKRLDAIELDRTKTKSERSGQIKVYKIATGILSFALLVLGVAAALHII